jgi:hypothetical protein
MILATLVVALGALYRLMPHPENVAPVAALALLGGMYFGRRYALWVPLAILAVTDLLLNARLGYPILYWPRVFDYGAFLFIGFLGLWAREKQTAMKVGCGIATPFLFFLVSNFGVWLFGLNLANEFYPKTLSGLSACYAAALPFVRGTIVGDWVFMGIFAAIILLVRRAANERWGWLLSTAKA